MLNEYYQQAFELPAGLDLETLAMDPTTSFPAAVQLGTELLKQGDPLGGALLEVAHEAFVIGMTTSASASSIISLLAAVIVFRFMPKEKPLYTDGEE